MSLTIKLVLLLVATILLFLSAIVTYERVDLFKLGWAFVIASLLVG